VQSEASLTATGDLVGTLRYMSPEQALAKRVPIDHRADVYSLGATLYELLTLERAFDGRDRQELLRQVAVEEPRPPRRVSRAVPVELETIVLKAMEKNPAERYGTAQELAEDLRRWLHDRPIRARRPTPAQRAAKWCKRHLALTLSAVAALTAVTALSSVSAVLLLAAYRSEKDAHQAETKQRQAAEAERTGYELYTGAQKFDGVAIQQESPTLYEIVVSGSGSSSSVVGRYFLSGALDTSFGGAGTGFFTTGSGLTVNTLRLAADGSIIVAGSQSYDSNGDTEMMVGHLSAGGLLDTSFPPNGTGFSYAMIGVNSSGNSLAIDPNDGGILACGVGSGTAALARFTAP
jgi:hypothetical protein